VADVAVDLNHDVEGPFLDQKLASIKEHASQIEALYEVFGDEGFRRFMSKEAFVVAATKGS
jgi:LmbE family N-acetylglucosaminyl deacetylase